MASSSFLQSFEASVFAKPSSFKRVIGRTMFETDSLPGTWVQRLNSLDEVWVPSTFNLNTFSGAGVTSSLLRVLHAGVDTTVFRPGLPRLFSALPAGFVFLSVFKWEQRKGIDILLRAYLSEFKKTDDVILLLKIQAPDTQHREMQSKVREFIRRETGIDACRTPSLRVVTGSLSLLQMARLYNTASAFVLPSRGEGYGRPYLEALSCGCPVIATRWGGQLDFLNDGNSLLLDVEALSPVPTLVEPQHFAGHRWALPSVDHLRTLMRRVFSNPTPAREAAAWGRQELINRFDWNKILPAWVEALM